MTDRTAKVVDLDMGAQVRLDNFRSVLKGLGERLDGWKNTSTGLGDPARDKMLSGTFEGVGAVPDAVLDALYHEDDLAAKIAHSLPEDATRRWFEVEAPAAETEGDEGASPEPKADLAERTDAEDLDDPEDLDAAVQGELTRLGAKAALTDAATWARVVGGAIVVIGAQDGLDPAQPLNEGAIKSVDYLTVLDKQSLTPEEWFTDAMRDGADFGFPKIYRITPQVQGASADTSNNVRVHASRVLRFDGARTSLTRRVRNSGWCDSILSRCWQVLREHGTSWQAVGYLMQDAAQGVFKLEGLIDMIASGDKEALQTRMQIVEMGRSVARSLMLDAEKESFERQAYSFTGLPEVLDRFMLRLAAAAEMPVTRLFGRAPAGLNATGESDIRLWYDTAQSFQTDVLTPRAVRLIRILARVQGSKFSRLAEGKLSLKWASLWQPTDQERATTDKTKAETAKIYVDAQIVLPEEVALAPDFPMRDAIDLDARREILEAETERLKEQAENPPEPMPVPGAPPAPGMPTPKMPPAPPVP